MLDEVEAQCRVECRQPIHVIGANDEEADTGFIGR